MKMAAPASVEAYITHKEQWAEALKLLRYLLLSTGMSESIKWGAPVYSLNGKNIVGLSAYKAYVGLWFFQGALLADEDAVLVNAQEGTTKAMRQWRFSSIVEIDEALVMQYVNEAIENQEQGREIKPIRKKKALIIPPELQQELAANPDFNTAFEGLSPSSQREYAEYIREAKRESTRWNRLMKIKPMVMNRQGLHDKYRK